MKKLKLFMLCLILVGCGQNIIKPDSPHMPIRIQSIEGNIITGTMAYPAPYTYVITYIGVESLDNYCVEDIIDVYYEQVPQLPELHDYEPFENLDPVELTTNFICPSDFKLKPGVTYKPVIYLYPQNKMNIHVSLDYNGTLTYTYPSYHDGWDITAYPNGTLLCHDYQYPYLEWEGIPHFEYDVSQGFCIKGTDSENFLNDKLTYLGLNDQEIKDFKEFWLPVLQENPYNIITFQDDCYVNNAKLKITPTPDTLIRVFITIKSSSHFVDIPMQSLTSRQRKGYSVIEWGGTILK